MPIIKNRWGVKYAIENYQNYMNQFHYTPWQSQTVFRHTQVEITALQPQKVVSNRVYNDCFSWISSVLPNTETVH